MTQARCPICARTFAVDPKALPDGFPFCSERCRLIDLGRWLDGDYVIPGRPAPAGPEPSGDGDARPEADDADEGPGE